jgi:hypothetical protein
MGLMLKLREFREEYTIEALLREKEYVPPGKR